MINTLKQYLKSIELSELKFFYGRSGNIEKLEWINIYNFKDIVYVQIYIELSEDDKIRVSNLFLSFFPDAKLLIVSRYGNRPYIIYKSETLTEDFIYSENGLKYYLDLQRPSHPGLFFDIEPARKWVMNNSKNCNVLNLFSFTCAFSVCAAKGGANSVINMDNNSNILSRGRRNHHLNNIDTRNISFEKKDILKSFGFIDKKGPYDIIVCDPPTSQKGSFFAKKDYPKLIRRLKETITEKGKILLCLNDPFLGYDFLEELVGKFDLKILRRFNPAKEFIQKNPEKGLKVLLVSKT